MQLQSDWHACARRLLQVMLYDDDEGDCITPEHVFDVLEEDLKVSMHRVQRVHDVGCQKRKQESRTFCSIVACLLGNYWCEGIVCSADLHVRSDCLIYVHPQLKCTRIHAETAGAPLCLKALLRLHPLMLASGYMHAVSGMKCECTDCT